MFINIHTHQEIHDAKIEVVNLDVDSNEKTIQYTYGLHPWYLDKKTFRSKLSTLAIVANEKRCLAIGECGLDKICDVDFSLQEDAFVEQIIIANKINKPLIIHCVKAFNEVINCLNLNNNKVPVIIHGFNNNENIARVMVNEGYYFSFGKALLGYDSNAAKAIKNVGRKNFFLETDDSEFSIKYIYKKAAELLGIDEEILQQQVQSNFENVFKRKLV
ncbi:MAG: TatD family hydrolase [Bacteroidota bacterium]|nr:TatD family hydrolase [Bacteroidota bacterium]MDP3147218.1 TatD family hydrolase [Bacteroidota bacterium]MDP3557708.1 TatD family hydrolase [Bacteroidota bacterium]